MAIEPETRVFPIAPGSSSTFWFTAAIVALTMILPAVLLLIPLWPGRIELDVGKSGVRITGSMYGRSIPFSELGDARKLTADDMPGYGTSARTNGVGLPNYRGGWFRLKNGSSALVFLTDPSRSVIVPTTGDYTLLVSPEDPDGFVAALAAVKSSGGGERDAEAKRFPLAIATAGGASLLPFFAIVSLVPLLIGGLLGTLTWLSRRVRFEVSSEGLRIRGPYGRLVPREALAIDEARTVDPKADPSYRVGLRTNGIGMPGYASGWFRLKGGGRALLFVTDRTRTVAIPTRLGYTVLLSPADPEGFLAALPAPIARPSPARHGGEGR